MARLFILQNMHICVYRPKSQSVLHLEIQWLTQQKSFNVPSQMRHYSVAGALWRPVIAGSLGNFSGRLCINYMCVSLPVLLTALGINLSHCADLPSLWGQNGRTPDVKSLIVRVKTWFMG